LPELNFEVDCLDEFVPFSVWVKHDFLELTKGQGGIDTL
jgi:hypothetical protein